MDQLFAEFGISGRESAVFRQLVSAQHATANELARALKLPRSTVYSALENLEKRGLVYKERKKRGTYFLPHRTDVLLSIIARDRDEFDSREERKIAAANELSHLLGPLYGRSSSNVPQIAIHEGQAAVESMLDERLEFWRQSIRTHDNTWWGYQDNVLIESYPRWFRTVEKTHKAPEVVRIFSNDSSTEKRLQGKIPRREIRLVPATMSFSSTIWILGEYIVTITTRTEPHFAFEVKNGTLANNMRTVFQMLWQLTGP